MLTDRPTDRQTNGHAHRNTPSAYGRGVIKLKFKGGVHDDFSFSHYLTSNRHRTFIFHPNYPILALKSFLGHFLSIWKNQKFSIFFDFGESPDDQKIFFAKIFWLKSFVGRIS